VSAMATAERAPGQPDPALVLPAAHAPAQDRADGPEPTGCRPFLVVDGTGLMVRCQRAARHLRLAASDGAPTGALMMFITSLARQIRQHDPSRALVCWDAPGSADWRRSLWAGYKGGRAPVPGFGSLVPTLLDRLIEFCAAAGIRQAGLAGFEADDLMASAVRASWGQLPGQPVIVCSDDKDLDQLTWWDNVSVCRFDGPVRWGRPEVQRAWAADASDLSKLRALAGDPSDGIPGLPGIGLVRARKMLAANGWRWPLGPGAIPDPEDREMVVKWRDIMDLVFPLRTPERMVGNPNYLEVDLSCRWHGEAAPGLVSFLEQYELTSVIRRLERGGLWSARS